MPETLQTTTTFSIEGYRITEYKGLVRGIVVRSPTIGQGFLGGLKQIVGGQIGAYAEMCEQAREQAYELLLRHARELRARVRRSAARGRRLRCYAMGPRSSFNVHEQEIVRCRPPNVTAFVTRLVLAKAR